MKQLICSALLLIGFKYILIAQNVYIPDLNFKDALVANSSINTNGDNEIQYSEATNYTGSIDVFDWNVHDLTGIEAFTAIQSLSCSTNHLTSLDVSANTSLLELNCSSNQLTSIDISANVALKYFYCGGNQLTNLDISANAALQILMCHNNQLTNLDVSSNTALQTLICYSNPLMNLSVFTNVALQYLDCTNNQLTSLDVSTNIDLRTLFCSSNQFTNLNVSSNTFLQKFYCDCNQLTTLNFYSNPSLQMLRCNNNQLSSLDLTSNTALQLLNCSSNQLTNLNVKNGNNPLIGSSFNATSNPLLTCIQVDDTVFSINNWWNIDTIAYFSEFCMVSSEQHYAESFMTIFPNPSNGKFTINCSLIEHSQLIFSNILGDIIYLIDIKSKSTEIDLSNQPKGIYFYQLQSNSKILENGKVIINYN